MTNDERMAKDESRIARTAKGLPAGGDSSVDIRHSLVLGHSSFSLGDLLEVKLDDPRVVVAVLRLHVLQDLSPEFTRKFAPGLAGILLQLLGQQSGVRRALRNAGPGGGMAVRRRLIALFTLL